MSWGKNLENFYNQKKMIEKIYNHFWEKYNGDNKDSYDKVVIHEKCKEETKFEIEKMNFIEDCIDWRIFDDYIRMLDKKYFNDMVEDIIKKGREKND